MKEERHLSETSPDVKRLSEENKALQEKVIKFEKAELKFHHFFENAPVGMYEIDFVSGGCTSVNRYVLDYTGYSREEFLAMNPEDFFTAASRGDFLERFEMIRQGESVPPPASSSRSV